MSKSLSLLAFFFLVLLQSCASSTADQDNRKPAALFRVKKSDEVAYAEIPFRMPQKMGKLIVIDAGHGGEDTGTISPGKPKYQEKSLTLVTAKMVQGYLNQMGYDTLMTRKDDTFIPLLDRALFANEKRPDLFVSVHYNSAPSKDAHGIEVFYFHSEQDALRTKSSKELASLILDQVILSTQAKSRGVKTANFAVIRETKMPAILIEGGFLTNQEELDRIKDPVYLKRLAHGIAEGVDRYLKRSRAMAALSKE